MTARGHSAAYFAPRVAACFIGSVVLGAGVGCGADDDPNLDRFRSPGRHSDELPLALGLERTFALQFAAPVRNLF